MIVALEHLLLIQWWWWWYDEILMYVQSIYMMRLRCYELYVQPRAELISSSDMIIEMHSMALFMRFRWHWNALHDIYLRYIENGFMLKKVVIYMYVLFSGKLYRFYGEGLDFWEKNDFEKICFCWPTPFCFSPLQVLDSLKSWVWHFEDLPAFLTDLIYVGHRWCNWTLLFHAWQHWPSTLWIYISIVISPAHYIL